MKWAIPGVFIATLIGLHPAKAQNDLGAKTQALVVIESAANSICYNVSQGGEKTTTILNGTMHKVASLNITGSAQLRTEHYRGVLQTELADTLKSSQDCKKSVFDTLVIRMIPTITADTGLPISRSVYLK